VLGKSPPVLSPQNLVSCDSADHGCQGGTLPSAWQYVGSNGLVSDVCMPYASGDGSNHTCPLPGCTGSGMATPFKCPVAPSFLSSDSAIQAAVMTVGAVEVGFFVMEDFMNYKSGIYKYQSGMQLGGHAVKIVGWGHEIEQFYWSKNCCSITHALSITRDG
jgi:cathepsin B